VSASRPPSICPPPRVGPLDVVLDDTLPAYDAASGGATRCFKGPRTGPSSGHRQLSARSSVRLITSGRTTFLLRHLARLAPAVGIDAAEVLDLLGTPERTYSGPADPGLLGQLRAVPFLSASAIFLTSCSILLMASCSLEPLRRNSSATPRNNVGRFALGRASHAPAVQSGHVADILLNTRPCCRGHLFPQWSNENRPRPCRLITCGGCTRHSSRGRPLSPGHLPGTDMHRHNNRGSAAR